MRATRCSLRAMRFRLGSNHEPYLPRTLNSQPLRRHAGGAEPGAAAVGEPGH